MTSRSPTPGPRGEDGEIVTAGGRVLNVTALGATPAEARDRAYEAARLISFDGMQMRTDIAARAVERTAVALTGRTQPMEVAEPNEGRSTETETATEDRAGAAEPMPEVEAAFEEIEVDAPLRRDHHGLEERQAEDAARRRGAPGARASATRSA